jgi:hypothetical protein
MVVNATADARQFSVGEAKKSLAPTEPVFKLLGKPANVRHAIFESPHDYNKAMREAMYGWMTLHLKGEGDGSPIPEPAIKTEDPEALRCYPGTTRPDDWVTIPKFAAAEGRKLLAAKADPKTADEWKAEAAKRRAALIEKVLGGFPREGKGGPIFIPTEPGSGQLEFQPEPGITLSGRYPEKGKPPLLVVLHCDGAEAARNSPITAAARQAGWMVATLELRTTGKLAYPADKIGRAPDHNTAEWGLWLGRPLLGQWVWDVRQFLTAVLPAPGRPAPEVVLIGQGPAGLVALAAAATDERIARVAAVGTLASYISEEPYAGQRLGVMAPGMLRHVGDVAHLAALCAPRRVVIAGGVAGNGKSLSAEQLRVAYRPAARVWEILGKPDELKLVDATDVIRELR